MSSGSPRSSARARNSDVSAVASSVRPPSHSASDRSGRSASRAGSEGSSSASARPRRLTTARMSWRVCAREPAAASRSEACERASAPGRRGPELLSVPERLLEVVADDLVLLLGAIAADAADPRGEPLVQVRPALLGDRVVRRVADQDVPESERLLAGDHRAIRPHELLADQRADQIGRIVTQAVGEQVADGAGVELLADHRGALDRAALVVGQAFETRGEQRRDRGWDRDRAEIAAGIQAPSSRTSIPSSISIESICSTNSGFPPAASVTRSAASAGEPRAAEQVRDQLGRRLASRGWSRSVAAFSLPPPQSARVSRNSGRAVHTSMIGASRGPVHDVVDRRRGTPARPSGCPPTARRAVVRPPGSPGTDGSPTALSSAAPTLSPTPEHLAEASAIAAACSSPATSPIESGATSSGASNAWSPARLARPRPPASR